MWHQKSARQNGRGYLHDQAHRLDSSWRVCWPGSNNSRNKGTFACNARADEASQQLPSVNLILQDEGLQNDKLAGMPLYVAVAPPPSEMYEGGYVCISSC